MLFDKKSIVTLTFHSMVYGMVRYSIILIDNRTLNEDLNLAVLLKVEECYSVLTESYEKTRVKIYFFWTFSKAID